MSGPKVQELPQPAGVHSAEQKAIEILRVWIVDNRDLATVFPPQLYGEDIWRWGRLLANVARYVAHAHAASTGGATQDAIEAIRLNFDEEIQRAGPPPEAARVRTGES